MRGGSGGGLIQPPAAPMVSEEVAKKRGRFKHIRQRKRNASEVRLDFLSKMADGNTADVFAFLGILSVCALEVTSSGHAKLVNGTYSNAYQEIVRNTWPFAVSSHQSVVDWKKRVGVLSGRTSALNFQL